MTWLAWGSLALILYTYFGYALLLRVIPRRAAPVRPVGEGPLPRVSVLLAVRNEAGNLGPKLENTLQMGYPPERMEILVGSDGSTDDTEAVARRFADRGVRFYGFEAAGKTATLNRLVQRASGDVLVFMDARQRVDPDALEHFAAWFEEPAVGVVGGELVITDEQGNETSKGVGVYWRYEKWLRRRESDLGLLTGVSGALYAMRRELYVAPPDDTILDDVMIPLGAARRGARVVVDGGIRMYDLVADEEREFRRKVRTLLGNWQMFGFVARSPRPFPARLLFSIVSHKLLRLLTPFALTGLLIGSLGMAPGLARSGLLWGQGLVYGAGLAALLARGRLRNPLFSVCSTFCLLNAAAGVAFWQFAAGRTRANWK